MSKFAVFLPLFLLVACGGSKPPAEAPKTDDTSAESAPKEKPASDDKPADEAAKSDAKSDDKAAAKKSDAPTDDGPKPTRTALDIVQAPDTVFEVSFNDSDVKQTADAKCSASSGNDPKKMNACMAKARKSLDIDAYRFKEKDGKWWWLWLRTTGKTVTTLHKFEVDFEGKDRSVVVKAKGKDLGQAPGRTPGPVTIDVPNDYQIVVTDPKLGKLVYNAKIGATSD